MSVERHKLYGLQAGRGIAAMLVVLHHAANHLKQEFGFLPMEGVFHFGRSGVDFFFVLSGFIIFFVHAKDLGRPARLGHYLLKRFTRIYPIYWLALLVLLTMKIMLGKDYSISDFLLETTLLPITEIKTLGVAWTLRFEIIFYGLFALAIMSLRLGAFLLFSWILAIILNSVSLISAAGNDFLNLLLSAWNIEFILGMLAAYYLSTYKLPKPAIILLLAVIGFMGTGILENMDILDGTQSIARLPYGIFSMLILMGLVEYERSEGLKIPNFFILIGEASYSIYLMHLFFIGIVYKVISVAGGLKIMPVWSIYIILFIAAILGGTLFSILAEKPSIQATRNIAVAFKRLWAKQFRLRPDV